MKIIIVGCGKVGRSIAQELVKENHNIILVDSNASLVEEVSNSLDLLGVIGNGASVNVLKNAGIEDADILLAVTSADEINMLCCLFAKKVNKNCKTIARVRNPMYNEEINYIRDELGLAMTINPEMITAREISRLIRWPNALTADSFVRGKVELISFDVWNNENIVGKKIRDIMSKYKDPILFVGIERGKEAIIPSGNTTIEEGDKVSIFATPDATTSFLNNIGIYHNPIKNCFIVGGSKIAYYLTNILEKNGIDVSIIDKDQERCNELAELLPKTNIICGYASDDNLLVEEGLPNADCFCSLTGSDEENVFLSMYAGTVSNAKLITKVNHIGYEDIIRKLNIGSLVSTKKITASNIVSYVRAVSNAGANDIETMHRILNNKAEALSFKIKEKSEIVGVPFEKMKIKDNLLICSIIRGNDVITPTGKDMIEIGDLVLVVTTHQGLTTIEEILK